MTTEVQREALKHPVETSDASHQRREEATALDRAGERAIEAKDRFTAFAREHPFTTVAGGLAIGILISGLFPRSPTRRLGNRAAGLAVIGAEAVRSYMNEAMDAAGHASRSAGRTGASRLGDWTDTVGTAARKATRDAAYYVGEGADTARTAGRDAGRRVSRALRRER